MWIIFILCCAHYASSSNSDINSVITYTPQNGWINDPNGCFYVDGKYHLMYQYNPGANKPANISWGHSVSEDLILWKEYGVAIPYNFTRHEAIFSGNAVYDDKNTSNLCNDADDKHQLPVVALYTSAFQANYNYTNGKSVREGAQVISSAFSCDENYRYFTEYVLNPVIPAPPSPFEDQWQSMRDPNIIWYEPHKRWIVSVALAHIKTVIWLASYNLLDWEYVGEFSWSHTPAGEVECPSLTQFNVENSNETKWVLLLSTNPGGIYGGSGMYYHVGDFDGHKFVKDDVNSSTVHWLDYGADCYAGILWNNINEKVMTFWLNNWRYSVEIGEIYKGALSSRKLQLRRGVNNNYKLYQTPIHGIYNYISNMYNSTKDELVKGIRLEKHQAYKLDFVIDNSSFNLTLTTETGNLSANIYYKPGYFVITRHTPELSDNDNTTESHSLSDLDNISNVSILLDNYTLTVYLNDGEILFTELVLNDFEYRILSLNNESAISAVSINVLTHKRD